MTPEIRIGIVGDFNPSFHSHHATNQALRHAADQLRVELSLDWIPTPSILDAGAQERLSPYDGLWLSPGSPYQSLEGALAAVEFARLSGVPFTAT